MDDDVADVVAGMVEDAVELQLPNTVESVGFADKVPLIDAVPFVDVVPLTPPPSKSDKVDVNAVIAEADVGAVEQPAPLVEPNVDSEPVVDSEPGVVGEIEVVVLKPPGLSSTEPKGIPVGPTVGATVVRGEVVPIADGVAVLTCARLGLLGNSAEIVAEINKAAILSLWSFRIGSHRRFRFLGVAQEGISPGRRREMMPDPLRTLFRKRVRICLFARCRESAGLARFQTKV